MNAYSQLLKRIQIKEASEVPEVALASFYQKMYPGRASFLKEHWRWLYRVGEFPQARPPLVALLDGEVIGHVAPIPIILKRGHQEKYAAWGVDGGVLSEYRKCGIGFKLMQIWTRQYPIVLGFCTEALFRILVKQGWHPRASTYFLQLPLRPDRHPRFQRGLWTLPLRLAGCGWNLLARVIIMARTEGFEKLREVPLSSQSLKNWSLLRHPQEFKDPVHVARSPQFLKWRLLDNPFREQYRILKMEDADMAAVVRIVHGDGLRQARILCLSGHLQDRGPLYRFFGSTVSWALDHKIDLITLVSSDPQVVRLARRWFPLRTLTRFVYYCIDPDGQRMMQESDHIWELIDYDFDFIR